MRIEEAIKQNKPFSSEFQKSIVNLVYTASWWNQVATRLLRPFGISQEQYNILRILRGMGDQPATIKTLTERMLDNNSNASRLVEKLKKKALVERLECPMDRRRVDITITAKGLQLLDETSKIMESDMHKNFKHLTEAEAQQLNELLDKMRG
ncbi:MarR family winged helix-turn-helix transcriptional regulator [Haliscomenobacter sp.]|uniref:MarR family winged helix-turn-helix transcriptional regulator n=1 Tax=Haliscomenobacter sp. TaxID=2717303 RepID=UPI00359489BE